MSYQVLELSQLIYKKKIALLKIGGLGKIGRQTIGNVYTHFFVQLIASSAASLSSQPEPPTAGFHGLISLIQIFPATVTIVAPSRVRQICFL